MKIWKSISIETSEASLAKFDRKTISFELQSIFQVTGFKFLLRFEKHLCSHKYERVEATLDMEWLVSTFRGHSSTSYLISCRASSESSKLTQAYPRDVRKFTWNLHNFISCLLRKHKTFFAHRQPTETFELFLALNCSSAKDTDSLISAMKI